MKDRVKWLKSFKVSDAEQSFRAWLTEQEGKHYATILYFKRLSHSLDLRLSSERRPALNFISHTVCGGSQAEALRDLDRWIKCTLGPNFAFEESLD